MMKIHSLLNKSESREAFVDGWMEWVTENGLANNQWLKDIFSIKQRWVPIFMKEYFLLG